MTRGGDGCRIAQWDGQEYRWTNSGLKGRAAVFARRFLPLENEEQRGDVVREPWPGKHTSNYRQTKHKSNGKRQTIPWSHANVTIGVGGNLRGVRLAVAIA